MSVLADLFQNINPKKKLPSAMEREGIRLGPVDNDTYNLALQNKQALNLYPEQTEHLINDANQETLMNGPEQLNLFATSGPEVLTDYLNSDAVTGMGADELSNIATQMEASNPGMGMFTADNAPGILSLINTPKGAGSLVTLARLFQMLSKR